MDENTIFVDLNKKGPWHDVAQVWLSHDMFMSRNIIYPCQRSYEWQITYKTRADIVLLKSRQRITYKGVTACKCVFFTPGLGTYMGWTKNMSFSSMGYVFTDYKTY